MVLSLIAIGVFILLCSGGTTLMGIGGGGTTRGEIIPVSVRANPSSYRPTYGGYTGYRAPVTSGSGGYSAGK